jgi:4-amino-4-deoxy-L-arabinose transferase-like glycosyltransferase
VSEDLAGTAGGRPLFDPSHIVDIEEVHVAEDEAGSGPDSDERLAAERAPGPGPTTFGQADHAWRTWIRPVLVFAVLGLVLRVLMVTVVHPTCAFDVDKWAQGSVTASDFDSLKANPDGCFQVGGDALYLFLQGRMLSEGKGYSSPVFFIITGQESPGAGKPPIWPAVIAGMNLVGLETPTAVRLMAALLGAAAVVLIGHTAGKLAGRRAATIAAALAAFYPMLWINDWKMLNDGPMILASAFVFYCAYTFWAKPRPKTAALLGLSVLIATFTRNEAITLLVFLILPLVWSLRRFPPSVRLRLGAVAWVTFAALYMPWLTYNLARFHQPGLLGGSSGSTAINSSCDSAWYGTNMGYLDFQCIDLLSQLRTAQLLDPTKPPSDESDIDKAFREQSSEYINENKNRAPIVLAARVGRMWDVYKPAQNLDYNINLEGRGRLDSTLGLISYFVLMPWAIGGLVVLYRRRITITPMLAFALAITLTAAITFGITRFRVPVEVGICLAAAVAFDAFLSRYVDARRALGTGTSSAAGASTSTAQPSLVGAVVSDVRGIRITPPDLAPRTWALIALPIVLVLGVLVWSSKVEPPSKGPRSNQIADPTVAACQFIRSGRLEDPKLYEKLDPNNIDVTIEAFTNVATVGPEPVATDARTISDLLAKAKTQGFVQGRLLDSLTQADRSAIGTAGVGFFGFAQKSC